MTVSCDSVGGVPQTPWTDLAVGNSSTQLGPFNVGTLVEDVTLVHEYTDICDVDLGDFSPVNTCPPPGEVCAERLLDHGAGERR